MVRVILYKTTRCSSSATRAEAPIALVTLQTIFQDAFPAYDQSHPLPAHVRTAARAIMQCRTAALGGHVQACPDGQVSRI
jgi:Transposase zinc-binding domain